MKDPHEVFLSTRDAAALRALLGKRSGSPFASELAPLLAQARIVAPQHLPADRAAIGSKVVYREEPAGLTRAVTLCHPDDADGALDRVSVLSPAGLAVLGRRPGSVVMATLRNGWPFTIRVLDAAPATEKEMT
jgi:regulator of nucleoside diphosphate kinase